jgi:hypothetical protein
MEKQKCQTKQTVLALHTPSDVIATAFSIWSNIFYRQK